MKKVGIIAEFNPFHNGHMYLINKVKELYPDSIIILVLNGYFLERGEISILSKKEKAKIALRYGIDIVCELPFVFGSQSADTFADASMFILNSLNCDTLVFGSECNNIELLTNIAKKEINNKLNIKDYLKEGLNYPTALNKAIESDISLPNDLLGISYIKSIIINNYDINPVCIQRTNNYHDVDIDDKIVSASNIRLKINNNIDVSKYTPINNFNLVNENKLFEIIKYKIITDKDLSKYLTVDEGIHNKIIKVIDEVSSLEDLILRVKSKRYTYNRIRRMFMHILVGLTKDDRNLLKYEYVKILGFNNKGQMYLKKLKSNVIINRKISSDYLAQKYELIAARIYDMLTDSNALKYELENKPIKNID